MARCEICGTEMTQGRGRARRTCSAACRQTAYRRSRADEVTALRAAAAAPALAPAPEPAPDDSPAGRIRAAGADLAACVDYAAWRAETNWTGAPVTAAEQAAVVRTIAERVAAAILASAPGPSRDEPAAAVPAPATPDGPAADTGPSRNDPPAKAPARRKRLTQKAARAVADGAQLVKDPGHRDTQRWNLVADDGTVLGHVLPSYGGTGRTGRNGWKYRGADSFVADGPYKTRQDAAVQCALSWIRAATTPPRRA